MIAASGCVRSIVYKTLLIILYFREKQKQLKEEKKEKRKTQKGERRR